MPSRRRLLAALGGTALAVLAGCTEAGDPWPGSGLVDDDASPTATPTADPNARPCSEQETVPDVTLTNTREESLSVSLLLVEVVDGEKTALAERSVTVPTDEVRFADRLFVDQGQRAQVDRHYLDVRDDAGETIETVAMDDVASAPARRGVTLNFHLGGLGVSHHGIEPDPRFNESCY